MPGLKQHIFIGVDIYIGNEISDQKTHAYTKEQHADAQSGKAPRAPQPRLMDKGHTTGKAGQILDRDFGQFFDKHVPLFPTDKQFEKLIYRQANRSCHKDRCQKIKHNADFYEMNNFGSTQLDAEALKRLQ